MQGARSGLGCTVFQVARSLGILDEVNRMKVVPGASPSSSLTNKNVRYMEVNILSAKLCFEKLDLSWIWFQYVSLHTAVISSELDLIC